MCMLTAWAALEGGWFHSSAMGMLHNRITEGQASTTRQRPVAWVMNVLYAVCITILQSSSRVFGDRHPEGRLALLGKVMRGNSCLSHTSIANAVQRKQALTFAIHAQKSRASDDHGRDKSSSVHLRHP